MKNMDIKEGNKILETQDGLKEFDLDQRLSDVKNNIEKEIKSFEDIIDPDDRIKENPELKNNDNELYEEKKYYTTEKDRIDKTPKENSIFGVWKGIRGNSEFIPSDLTEEGKKAIAKLAEYGLDGVMFKKGEPDFSKCSEANVEIKNMTEHRKNYLDENGSMKEGNFAQADRECAVLWTKEGKVKEDGTTIWIEKDVYKWRHENKYTWHECCDTKSMNLVSRDIHGPGKFTHSGGRAECRIRDSKEMGGVFDE